MTEATPSMESAGKLGAHPPAFQRIYVWELPVRLFHWINALCLTVLFATGLYIAHPILIASGEAWNNFVMGWVRLIHFAAAYVFTATFLWRLVWMFLGNQYAASGVPRFWRARWWANVTEQALDYARLSTGRPHLGHNDIAGLSYSIFIVGLGLAQVFTGFALYSQSNPGGFWDRLVGWVIPLLGSPYNTVMWHHLIAWSFVVFAILHVYIVMLDSREFRNGLIGSMIHGHKFWPLGKKIDRDD